MCFKHINIYEHQFWNAIDNDNEIMRRDIAMSNKLSNYKLFTMYYTSAVQPVRSAARWLWICFAISTSINYASAALIIETLSKHKKFIVGTCIWCIQFIFDCPIHGIEHIGVQTLWTSEPVRGCVWVSDVAMSSKKCIPIVWGFWRRKWRSLHYSAS